MSVNSAENATIEPRYATASVKEWVGLAVLALPTLLLGLDITILYLALPALAEALQPSSTQALWIMDIYGFMIAGFLVTMGALGDRIGRRKLLMIGAFFFALASIVAAYAPNAELLIIARALLGIAGATLMPSTLALISNLFQDARQRAFAIGIWATMFALGMALGPVVGGVLLELYWWGSAFLVAVPIIFVLLCAAPIFLPEYKNPSRANPDISSVFLSLLAILPIIYAFKELSRFGLSFSLIGYFGLGIIGLWLFIQQQSRLSSPMLDLQLFSNKTFNVALLVLLTGLVGVAGMMLIVTQYLQLIAGYSPVVAGLWMGPPALMMVLAGLVAPLLVRRFTPATVLAAALLLASFGCGLVAIADPAKLQVGLVVSGFSLIYFGLGALAALGTDLVVSSAPLEQAGSASAMSEMAQELGVALGVALLGSLALFVYQFTVLEQVGASSTGVDMSVVQEGLWAVEAAADTLENDVQQAARFAFNQGMQVVAILSGVVFLTLAFLTHTTLRQVGAKVSNQLCDQA
ncbi:MFS transporter [Alkalimonas collagenimarina]|uniref:MFS transporter n=1 Tax=Alkalimonas collagenimarina TaxID=400390 RepID=A0ABT9GUK4_9GAMM|nr:MFS transporter [Alkalimonas collagenimarina]MDP4534736.1 MFS transporter [Alkalimonas collagenimarina]